MGQQPLTGLQITFLPRDGEQNVAGPPRGDKPPAGRRQEDKGSSAAFFQGPDSHGLWRKITVCCWLWGREGGKEEVTFWWPSEGSGPAGCFLKRGVEQQGCLGGGFHVQSGKT